MFKVKDWENFRSVGKREPSFDWHIPNGYIIFGAYGMKVCKRIRGRWMYKMVNDWRSKDCKTVNAEIKDQEWEAA